MTGTKHPLVSSRVVSDTKAIAPAFFLAPLQVLPVSSPEYSPLHALKTGIRCRCPRCAEGELFQGYLTIRKSCPKCELDYSFADPADGPAFFVMSVVGLIGMIGFMIFDFTIQPPIWVHFVTTLPVVSLMCLAILRPFKGWMICEQYYHKAIEATFKTTSSDKPD